MKLPRLPRPQARALDYFCLLSSFWMDDASVWDCWFHYFPGWKLLAAVLEPVATYVASQHTKAPHSHSKRSQIRAKLNREWPATLKLNPHYFQPPRRPRRLILRVEIRKWRWSLLVGKVCNSLMTWCKVTGPLRPGTKCWAKLGYGGRKRQLASWDMREGTRYLRFLTKDMFVNVLPVSRARRVYESLVEVDDAPKQKPLLLLVVKSAWKL